MACHDSPPFLPDHSLSLCTQEGFFVPNGFWTCPTIYGPQEGYVSFAGYG